MNRTFSVWISILVLSACSQADQQAEVQPATVASLVSGIILENMDCSVAPGDDFSAYVNGTWMKNTEIPADKSSYGVGYMVHEKSREDVKAIIEESASTEFADGSDEQKVGDLFQSFMDMDKRNEIGVAPLADEMGRIDALENHGDLAAYFSHALVAQYDEFEVFSDLKVNGTFTLGENIGDLGGLSIALKAYQITLDGKMPELMDGFTGEQRVFIGYAQSWLSKSREERLRQQVGTNPHSPAKFRVNGVIRNIPEFYDAFDVQAGDALYLAPEDRVKIW